MPRPRNSSSTAACSAGSIRSSRAISQVTASTDERSSWASNCEASDCSRLTSTIAALRSGAISVASGCSPGGARPAAGLAPACPSTARARPVAVDGRDHVASPPWLVQRSSTLTADSGLRRTNSRSRSDGPGAPGDTAMMAQPAIDRLRPARRAASAQHPRSGHAPARRPSPPSRRRSPSPGRPAANRRATARPEAGPAAPRRGSRRSSSSTSRGRTAARPARSPS